MMKKLSAVLLASSLMMTATSSHAWFWNRSQGDEVETIEQGDSIRIPEWYIQIPEATDTHIFVPGVGTSSSLNMAVQKAQMDADVKLAFHTNASVTAMMEAYQNDTGRAVVEDTELAARRITEIFIQGQQQHQMAVFQEPNGQFRVFVLMRYPTEPIEYFASLIQRQKIQSQRDQAFDRLDNQASNQTVPSLPNNTNNNSSLTDDSSAEVFKLQPASEVDFSTLPHNDISDQELRSRIDQILQRPDAVVGSMTLR